MTGHDFVASHDMKTGSLCAIRWVFGWSITRSRPKVCATWRMLKLAFMKVAIHCLEMGVMPIVWRPIWSRDTARATVGRIGAVDRLLAAGWRIGMWRIRMWIGQVLRRRPLIVTFIW
jgi:hypothetical protein